MSEIGLRGTLFIGGGLLLGVALLGAGLVFLLTNEIPVDEGELPPEGARPAAHVSVDDIPRDAEPSASFELHHALPDGKGGLLVLGVVRNTSATFVDRPELVAVCRDEAGQERSRSAGQAEREVLLPQGTSPIEMAVPDGEACAKIDYEVVAKAPEVVAVYAPGLRVASHQLQQDQSGAWEITGQIANDGDRAARYVSVQVLAVDVVGRIVGVDAAYAKGDLLLPGATTRFRLGPLTYLKPPTRFEFTAYGRSAD